MPHVWEMAAMERRYSVPPSTISEPMGRPHPTEDLHAWSIYRQNLNSDFTDSALGSSEKSPLPYGNFQLRESTVHSILSHPKYGPHGRASDLGPNMFTYLKFGLPRVFPPPRGLREGSSGYDSSDDGGSPYMDREGRFRRSRSDPDFRNHIIRRQEIGSGSETTWWRDKKLRSNSEANLLNQDLYGQQQGKTGERRAAERSDISTHKTVASSATAARRAQGAASKAGSQISVASHVTRSHVGVFGGMVHSDGLYGADGHLINEKFFPKDSLIYASDESALKHPHLQVRGLTYEEPHNVPWKLGLLRRRVRILENLTFEVRSGELLGIMATNEYEGTALLNVLASKKTVRGSRVRADIIVNGTRIPLKLLKDRIAYVQQDCNFAEDMSVRQTMLFASLLQEPGNQMRSYDTKGRINALIEDMGLGLVKHTRVKNLTMSEKRRLNVACRLLLDTDIVLLDLPTKGMDIFDTFFLIEYLRQWASRGRIVIVTIQPPTYEIFTMLTEVALISTGRMMYFGRRREMLPYFAFIEYPCPAYKNPADYYLDLVTLDNLSPEAMLESSQRVDLLAETFRRRQEALSDPGPPSLPPPKFKRAGLLVQILALWIRALIYMFPYNLITFARNIIIAAGLSVLIGAIYYNVRLGREQDHILDRFAFHYVMLGVAIWPIILLTITEVWSFKDAVVRDISDGLYWKSSYIITKMQYSFLSAGGVFLAYVIPAYCMAGLKNEVDNITFSIYIGYILMYLYAIRALSMAMAYMCQSRHLAAIYTGLILTFVIMCSGYPVHLQDLSIILSWFQWVSPMKWVMEQLDIWDIARTTSRNLTFICSRNPVVVQEQPRNGLQGEQTRIMLRSECGIQTGAQALAYFSLQESLPFYFAIVVTFAFWGFWQILLFIAFFNCHQSQKKSRTRYLRIFQ